MKLPEYEDFFRVMSALSVFHENAQGCLRVALEPLPKRTPQAMGEPEDEDEQWTPILDTVFVGLLSQYTERELLNALLMAMQDNRGEYSNTDVIVRAIGSLGPSRWGKETNGEG